MSNTRQRTSLRTRLIVTIAFCWVLPIMIVSASGVFLLHRSYERSMHQELELAGDYAISQTASRFEAVLFNSKTVSYDGVVRSAYRSFSLDGDSAALYRSVTNYLNQQFSRRESVDAVFLSFWNEPDLMPYVSNQGEDPSRTVRAGYREIEPMILSDMADADTSIRLYEKGGQLYAARNLLDSRMNPYATVVMSCNVSYLTAPLASLNLVGPAWGEIDGILFSPDGILLDGAPEYPDADNSPFMFSSEVDGHRVTLHAHLRESGLFSDAAEMPVLLGIAAVLVVFLLFSVFRFFSTQVARPVRTLVEANRIVENGNWGYRIEEAASNREFDALYRHFNSMSEELQKQFSLAMEEQQALHQVKIKALQSQINPHFLNNTLEVINWESRIAGNERVTAMIEALATMLNTSLNRDDDPRISFDDELHYTEAYLYIIKQRMGDRLEVEYDIDPSLSGKTIPRMILQPLVENAIEHDLSRSSGGRLCIRAKQDEGLIRLSVEHNGHMLPEDRERLERLLQPDAAESADRVHIGIRNVAQRLRLMYGTRASLSVEEVSDGLICAGITLPDD